MNVLLTVAIIVAAAAWASTIYTRLTRLRTQVKHAWKHLEIDRSNEAVRTVYNRHVDLYNAALNAFPASLFGSAIGFKPARKFEP